MFLGRIKLICIILYIFIFIENPCNANTEIKLKDISDYLFNINNFSASFIQESDGSIEEGKLYIGQNRVRADYISPTKIMIVLDANKAMYYNYELDEAQFFDPRKTSAWFFFEIFNDSSILIDSNIIKNQKNIVVEKIGFHEDISYNLKLFFETSPLVIRKIKLEFMEDNFILSFNNHNYFEEYDKKFFKLINPSLINNQ